MANWKCPKHKAILRGVEDYPGALIHSGCMEIFTVIGNSLCILEGGTKWIDTKTGELKTAEAEGKEG